MIVQRWDGHFYNPIDPTYLCECSMCRPIVNEKSLTLSDIQSLLNKRAESSLDAFSNNVGGVRAARAARTGPRNRPGPRSGGLTVNPKRPGRAAKQLTVKYARSGRLRRFYGMRIDRCKLCAGKRNAK